MKVGSILLSGKPALDVTLRDDGKVELVQHDLKDNQASEYFEYIKSLLWDQMIADMYGRRIYLFPVREETFTEVVRRVAAAASHMSGLEYSYDGWIQDFPAYEGPSVLIQP